ncbi:MAG: hypothetical protein ABIZ70_01390 [Gemmatimonadales bacterium]
MTIINARVHALLDYVVVCLLAVAPTVFHFAGVPATLAYALAAVHLVLTLCTDFPGGVLKLVPLSLHGAVEFVVSLALVGAAWILKFSTDINARNFYVGTGVLILLVWLLTDYKSTTRALPA